MREVRLEGSKLKMLVPDNWDYRERERRFNKLCASAQAVFSQRNEQYGDGIRYGGLFGAVIELIGCVLRLQKLVIISRGRLDRDAILNALQDAHNYANIAAMMLEDNNIHGQVVAKEITEE